MALFDEFADVLDMGMIDDVLESPLGGKISVLRFLERKPLINGGDGLTESTALSISTPGVLGSQESLE